MRGLKLVVVAGMNYATYVALLVSAWIETITDAEMDDPMWGRTPRECVD